MTAGDAGAGARGQEGCDGEGYPPVTFVVFAFNQQDMVGEAIDAALAQDYPNLQILLSDDGSHDGTFAVMQDRVAAYRGPHRVAAIQTPRNGGLVHHVLYAASHADGELIVCAAGDDISLPHRTSTLVEHWQRDHPAIIYSAWNRVTLDCRLISRDGIATQHERDLAAYFPGQTGIAAFGCTTAYAATFLHSVPDPGRSIWSEDYFLSALAMLAGEKIAYIDQTLVNYRQNPAALRNFASANVDYRHYEERENRFFEGLAALATSLLEIVDRGALRLGAPVNRAAIVSDIAWYRYRAEWSRCNVIDRLRYVSKLRSGQRLRWAVPRLVGLDMFIAVKGLASPLRRKPRAVDPS